MRHIKTDKAEKGHNHCQLSLNHGRLQDIEIQCLSYRSAAHLLGISIGLMKKLCGTGEVRYCKIGSGKRSRVLIPLLELENFLKKRLKPVAGEQRTEKIRNILKVSNSR